MNIDLKIEAVPVAPYFQAKERIREYAARHLSPGDRIPSERDLAESSGLARATVAKAINQLVSEGLLVRIHGKGTFVSGKRPEAKNGNYLRVFTEDVKLKRAFKICVIYSQRSDTVDDKFMQECLLLEEIDSNMRDLFNSHPATINLDGMPDPFQGCLAGIDKIKPDGVIIIPKYNDGGLSRSLTEKILERGLKVVSANGLLDAPGAVSVICDHAEGMRLLVEHLTGLGHKDIALVTRDDNPFWVEERTKGFQDACRKNGAPGSAENIIRREIFRNENGRLTPGSYINMGYAAGRELFKARKHSALIGVNDSTAVGLLQAAAEAGMSAPDDCSVAGFDDYYPFRGHNLTTIRYPAREIAENALGALLLKLHNFKAARIQNITVVPPTLIKRYTTSIPERKTREA